MIIWSLAPARWERICRAGAFAAAGWMENEAGDVQQMGEWGREELGLAMAVEWGQGRKHFAGG